MTGPGRSARERAADGLTAFMFRSAWAAVRSAPAAPVYRLADAAADVAWRRRGRAAVQFARNQARVLGRDGRPVTPAELGKVTRAGLRSYARYWVETFRLPAMDHAAVADRALADTSGLEYLDAAQAAGRGFIMALPHSGNWDVAGLMIARRYGRMTTVAERLKPERLYAEFLAYRESLGMEILPLTGGPSPSGTLKERLRAGGIVCLLADRDLSASGVPVTFFGHGARMPAGPALLAALTGADLCPVHLSFTPTGWRQVIHPPVALTGTRLAEQVATGTQTMADRFADDIAAYPADWHMLQPLFTADLTPR